MAQDMGKDQELPLSSLVQGTVTHSQCRKLGDFIYITATHLLE